MDWRIRAFTSVFAICLFVAGCGSSKSSSNSIPTAQDPLASPSPSATALPIPTPTPDSRIPDLTLAVSINLADKVNYSDLINLAGNVYLPLVGDPKILMHYTNTRSQLIYGDILVAFEDAAGFWGAKLNSFSMKSGFDSSTNAYIYGFNTGFHVGAAFDMIFADTELVVRTIGTVSGDDLTGTIYYRRIAAGETQCMLAGTVCPVNSNYNPYLPPSETNPIWICDFSSKASSCTNYINPTDTTHVKSLGTFKSSYSNWATLPEVP